jgi:hypothetical protein
MIKAVAGNDEGDEKKDAELAALKASAELHPQEERSLGRVVMEELKNQLMILAPPAQPSKQLQPAIGGVRVGAARPRSTPQPQQQHSQQHHEGNNEFAEELLHLVDKALLLVV